MATVLLAIGDSALRRLCLGQLTRAGHDAVVAQRALQVLDIGTKVLVHVLMVDDTALGRDALSVGIARLRVGLGLQHGRLDRTLPLPLSGPEIAAAVNQLTPVMSPAGALTLEPGRRVARANGREVALTRTEYQLLDTLVSRRGGVVALDEAMEALWGAGDWSRNLSLLRAHMRNLRLKLAQLGLSNAVRSRRGKGYALAL
jgi:hypothetical protein